MSEVEFTPPETEIALDVPVPLLWRVVIEPQQSSDTTDSGIFIPDETKESQRVLQTIGRIVRIGQLAFQSQTKAGLQLQDDSNASSLREGDWVMFGKGGARVKMRDGREYVICNDDQILCTVEAPNQYEIYI